MSEGALEPAILAPSSHEPDDMESQDSEITAFGEINIEPFQKQYINGQSTPIDAVDALETDDVDNLPYPTAFDEEDNANQPTVIKPSDYHIEDEDETIIKKPEDSQPKESNEQQEQEENAEKTITEKNQGENLGEENDQNPNEKVKSTPGVLSQMADYDADPNGKGDDPKEPPSEDVNTATSAESGDGVKQPNQSEPTNPANEPANTNNQQQTLVPSSEDTREEFDNPELTAAQFGQQFTLQVTDENYQESLGKQAFPQVYMPVSIQYNPETEQYQERSGEQYVNQQSQMVQMPSGAYFRTYAGQQVLKQQLYNPQTNPRGRQPNHQNDYNQENISPQQQQQYNQRLQTIGIPTPTPEVLAQYERQQQQTPKPHPTSEMYVHGPPEGSVEMSIPASCCVQYSSPSMSLPQDQNIGRQPARIVNGKKIGVKPVNPKFDRTRKFPEKLYAVACDPNIDFIRWSATGKAIIVNEKEFERRVMSDCPGLVQSDAFDNFRRQLREYQFECRYINMPFQYDYEFLHPDFQYEREDLLHRVKTRRRVMRLSQSSHPDSSPPRKLLRRSSSFGRRSSRGAGIGVGGCGNPACHQHISPPPPPQAPWPYSAGGAYASGDAPLPSCASMFPSCAGHVPQWAAPQPHTYNCSHTPCGSSSSPEAASHTPVVTTEDNQQWQAQQGQQMWYTSTSTPTPQALYAAANWYPHPQAPASSITQPVAVVQNPQVVSDNPTAQDENTQEPRQEQDNSENEQNKEAEEPSTGQEMAQQLLQDPAAVKREKEGDPDSPQVVELTEPPRMSPITVQLRQVGGSEQRAFAQKLSVANMANMSNLSSITSLGRLVQPLGTIYGQLETGAGDSMGPTTIQLQQPDSQPTQTQPSLRQISA